MEKIFKSLIVVFLLSNACLNGADRFADESKCVDVRLWEISVCCDRSTDKQRIPPIRLDQTFNKNVNRMDLDQRQELALVLLRAGKHDVTAFLIRWHNVCSQAIVQEAVFNSIKIVLDALKEKGFLSEEEISAMRDYQAYQARKWASQKQ